MTSREFHKFLSLVVSIQLLLWTVSGIYFSFNKIESKSEDNENINVYVDPFTKEIVAIRSTQWRIWDFMWGFHIMDWDERDNVSNIFLKIFSILALLSALSGIYLFFTANKDLH